MGKMTMAASFGLAWLLSTATVALAADPGAEDPNNWPQYHRTSNAWRYSPLDQINKNNVSKLSVAWIAQGGDITMGIQETPLAIDGVIYSITAGNRVAALDGKTGQELWSFQPKLDPSRRRCCSRPIVVASRWGTAWSSSARWMGAASPSIKRPARKNGRSS